MSEIANYIIKQGDQLTIHYNRWRAPHIGEDLYLGEKAFLSFVRDCTIKEELTHNVWLEGCVIIDISLKRLYFFSWHLPMETSVREYYMSIIGEKWKGWEVQKLMNQMYDGEKVLGIDYISRQELSEPEQVSEETIINDHMDPWTETTVIIKDQDQLFVTKTGNVFIEGIISYGPAVIPLLQQKPNRELPREEASEAYRCAIFDISNKHIYVSESQDGLWEQCASLWPGYTFTMGDFGYIGTLRLAGIDAEHLRMPMERILKEFNDTVKIKEPFDPSKMAALIMKDHQDAQFHPDFFDNVQPKETALTRFVNFFKGKFKA